MDEATAKSGAADEASGLCPFHGDQSRASAPDASAQRKTMVLTGASRGIGHATVKLFSLAGWRIITCSGQPFNRDRCPWEMGPEDHVQVDLADHRSVPLAIADIRARLNGGPLHALVNNAGISPKGADNARMTSLMTSTETWMSVFHVNFLAPIMLARGLFGELKQGGGTVVNVTSIVSGRVHPFAGTAYATSKAALACLTREMAHDFAPHGIRVNGVAPGPIWTALQVSGGATQEKLKNFGGDTPMMRPGQPAELASIYVQLAANDASFTTGNIYSAGGGKGMP